AAVALPTVSGTASAISDVNFSARYNFPMLRDPVRLLSPSTVSPIYGVSQLLNLLVILVAALSLLLRFRSSQGEERQPLKWIAFAGGPTARGFLVLASIPNRP